MKLASDKHKSNNDAWLSLVERCVRDAEAAGSNPVASIKNKEYRQVLLVFDYSDLNRIQQRPHCVTNARVRGRTLEALGELASLSASASEGHAVTVGEAAGSNPVASIQKTDTSRYPFFLYVFSVRRFVSGSAFLSDRLKRGDRQIDGQNNQHNCDNRLYDIPRILSCHFDLRDDRQDQ